MAKGIKQAGAIVLRTVNQNHEVLLIMSKKKPRKRIFPKGHVELGETFEETAHRELMEEAGVKGELIRYAGNVYFTRENKSFDVAYFIFSYQYNVSAGEDGRDPAWYSPLEAYELLPSDDLRELFRQVVENYAISQ